MSPIGHLMAKSLHKAKLDLMFDLMLTSEANPKGILERTPKRNRVPNLTANHLSNHVINRLANLIANRLLKLMLNRVFCRLRNRMSNRLADQVTNHLLNHLCNRLVKVMTNHLFNRQVKHLRNLVVNHQANEAPKGYPGGGLGERCLCGTVHNRGIDVYVHEDRNKGVGYGNAEASRPPAASGPSACRRIRAFVCSCVIRTRGAKLTSFSVGEMAGRLFPGPYSFGQLPTQCPTQLAGQLKAGLNGQSKARLAARLTAESKARFVAQLSAQSKVQFAA